MINIFICDDSEQFKAKLNLGIEEYCKGAKIDFRTTLISSVDEIKKHISSIDILFLDVMLGDINSINKLSKENISLPFETVILTSHSQEIYNISKLEPTYYLDKSRLDKNQLFEALEKCIHNFLTKGKQKVIIEQGKASVAIDLRNVSYIEAQGRSTIIHFNKGVKTKANIKFSDFVSKCGANFQQCSRSFAVNFDYVLGFERCKYIMYNGEQITISRSNYKNLTDKYKKYLEQ